MGAVFKRQLPVKLNDKEREEIAEQQSKQEIERERVQNDKRLVNSNFRKKLNDLDTSILSLARSYESGTVEREVDCEEKKTKGGEIHIIRLDTKEIVDRRTMSLEERQEGLFGEETALPADPEVAPSAAPKKRGRKPKNGVTAAVTP